MQDYDGHWEKNLRDTSIQHIVIDRNHKLLGHLSNLNLLSGVSNCRKQCSIAITVSLLAVLIFSV